MGLSAAFYKPQNKKIQNMEVTLKFDIDRRYGKRGGCNIFLLITKDREKVPVRTGKKISPETWDEGEPADELNSFLKEYMRRAELEIKYMPKEYTAKEIKHNLFKDEKAAPVSVKGPPFWSEAIEMYKNYLNGVGVDAHKFKKKDPGYILDIERTLKKAQGGIGDMKVNRIDDFSVGRLYTYLLDTTDESAAETNKVMACSATFFKVLKDHFKQKLDNPFSRYKPLYVAKAEAKAIKIEQLPGLFTAITPENSKLEYKKGKVIKYMYRPWLKEAIYVGLFSGGRLGEAVYYKYKEIDPGQGHLMTEDYKVTRKTRRSDKEAKKYKPVSIAPQLWDLLKDDYEQYKDTERYIVAPDDPMNRETLKKFLSRAFTHFWKKAYPKGPAVTFKSLRKTYATYAELVTGGSAEVMTGHSDRRVLDSHYVDKGLIATEIGKKLNFPLPEKT